MVQFFCLKCKLNVSLFERRDKITYLFYLILFYCISMIFFEINQYMHLFIFYLFICVKREMV